MSPSKQYNVYRFLNFHKDYLSLFNTDNLILSENYFMKKHESATFKIMGLMFFFLKSF